jgi:Icc-related predicted phosphoesterase
MGLFQDEKRKNDSPRRIQWWLLVTGIAIGIVVTLIAVSGRSPSNTVSSVTDQEIYITATWIVDQATQTKEAAARADTNVTPAAPSGDPMQITATTIIQRATQTAGALTEQAGS